MTILRIHDYLTDRKPLARVAREVRPEEFETDAFQVFLRDLKETLLAAGGAGLAATQVDASAPDGSVWSVFVMGLNIGVAAMVNPVITASSDEKWLPEGCLSFRSVRVTTKQATRVEYTAQNEDGRRYDATATEFEAMVFSHETAHLQGKTIVDRMTYAEKQKFLAKVAKAKRLRT